MKAELIAYIDRYETRWTRGKEKTACADLFFLMPDGSNLTVRCFPMPIDDPALVGKRIKITVEVER